MKKCLSLILTVLLLLTMVPTGAVFVAAVGESVPVAAKTGGAHFDVSGDLNVSKPTKEEIKAMWRTTTHNTKNVYIEEPSASAPYKAGKLTDEFLDNGLTYLNYVRYVAGLPAVQLDASLNENAQYGAVILAQLGELTHYPEQPADMDDDFYRQAAAATSTSNLGAGDRTFADHVQGCMDDLGSSNIARVGHRRWLLNPTLLNVGFGFAESYYGYYSATKVLDRSGEGCDFDFVAWPPSGNFPTHLLSEGAPWSISLNPNEYKQPVLENLYVTIQRESDGETWVLDGKTDTSDIETGYLTVENSGYGINNCIIFHPGWDYIDGYNGVYTVEIQGLYTRGGEEADLCYQVDFFDMLCGPVGECWWELEGTHLTISGNGQMDYSRVSWGTDIASVTTDIASVTIEEGVTSIGDSVFGNCSSLTSITIPNSVTTIGEYTFAYCTSLMEVTLPDSITTIGELAFFGCDALTDVYYSGTLADREKIAVRDFHDSLDWATWHYHWPQPHVYGAACDADCNICGAVRDMTNHTYDNAGDADCNVCGFVRYLTYVIVDGEVTITGYDESLSGDLVIPATIAGYPVTTIGEYTFSDCTSLMEVTLPDSITTIGAWAFYGCDALTDVYYSGTQADREKIRIGGYNYSLNLATWHYHWPQSHVYSVACDVDCNICGAVRDVTNHTYDNACDADCNVCGFVRYLTYVIVDGEVTITGYDKSLSGDLVIPATIAGYPVTTIGERTFFYCTSLMEVTLPDSITTIGAMAFYGCNALTDVYYSGSEADREKIGIGEYNYSLDWATWHYNYVPEPESILGDADGNGKVNNRDLGRLQQYLNGYSVTVNTIAADLDDNGKVNNRDLGLLQQLLNQ